MREYWSWGANPWPIHWCELVKRNEIDCGALAAIARAVIASRGQSTASVQLVQRYSSDDTGHWESCWARRGLVADWLDEDIIYHEAVAVLGPSGTVRIWDPTDTAWLEPISPSAYGGILAVRILADPPVAESLRWGASDVLVGGWITFSSGIADDTFKGSQ